MVNLISSQLSRAREWFRGELDHVRGIGGQLLKFLRVSSKKDVHRWNKTFPVYHHADLCRAFRDFFATKGMQVTVRGISNLVFPGGYPSLDSLINTGAFSQFGSVGKQVFETAPEQSEELVTRAAFFVGGGPYPLVCLIHCENTFMPVLELLGAAPQLPEAVEWAGNLMDQLDEWLINESCLRRHILRPSFRPGEAVRIEFVPVSTDATFQLSPELQEELEETFLDFLERRETLERAGIDCQRGLLLCGPPGTGKTSTCRYLKTRLPDHTMVVVGTESLLALKDCFDLARRFAPSILVIEDVDGIAQLREPNQTNWVLGELMNQMDGLQARDRVAVLLTSNSWEFLEKALAERPGRVDHIVLYGPPATEHRRVLLGRFLGSLELEIPLDNLVEMTDGMTPAQLKEVIKRASVASLRRSGDAQWSRRLWAQDVTKAVASVRTSPLSKARRPIGLDLKAVPRSSAGSRGHRE